VKNIKDEVKRNWRRLYSAFADKVKRNCYFPTAGWSCMTHRQALKDLPVTGQVSLRKKQ
jgi:hypothetical protein